MPDETVQNLKTLLRPCNNGMCPALYSDDQGRVFVQGSKLGGATRSELSVASHEEVVEITPELLTFLRSHPL